MPPDVRITVDEFEKWTWGGSVFGPWFGYRPNGDLLRMCAGTHSKHIAVIVGWRALTTKNNGDLPRMCAGTHSEHIAVSF